MLSTLQNYCPEFANTSIPPLLNACQEWIGRNPVFEKLAQSLVNVSSQQRPRALAKGSMSNPLTSDWIQSHIDQLGPHANGTNAEIQCSPRGLHRCYTMLASTPSIGTHLWNAPTSPLLSIVLVRDRTSTPTLHRHCQKELVWPMQTSGPPGHVCAQPSKS